MASPLSPFGKKGESVTHVSGTICYLCLGSVISLGNHDLQPNSNALLLQNLFSKSHATAEVAGPSSYFAEVAASKPSKWAGFSQLISLISASVIPAPLSAAIYIFHPSTKGG